MRPRYTDAVGGVAEDSLCQYVLLTRARPPGAGVTGLTFHDLRAVHLALVEATVPQIATFAGHSLKDVEAILDTH